MPGPNITEQQSLFPSRDTLDEVESEGLAQLPITSPNKLVALLRLQQNTIIKMMSAGEIQ